MIMRHDEKRKDEQVNGYLSAKDVASAVISDQDTTISMLENYIAGNEYTSRAHCP